MIPQTTPGGGGQPAGPREPTIEKEKLSAEEILNKVEIIACSGHGDPRGALYDVIRTIQENSQDQARR